MHWCSRSAHVLALHFGLCLDEKQFSKIQRKLQIKDNPPQFLVSWHSSAAVHFFENRKEGKVVAVVCLKEPPKSIPLEEIYGLLVHEAVHIWHEHKLLINEKEPSAEFECYGIQHIAQQLMAAYAKLTKPKPRAKRKTRR